MKRILVGLLIFAFITSSFASHAQSPGVDVTGLSELQRAEIAKQAALLKEQNQQREIQAKANKEKHAQTVTAIVNNPPPQMEKLNDWANAGVQLGKALAAVAKELGVAVNDFATTPVGKMTAAVILYKFMGKEMIKLIVGSLFLMVAGSIWFYAFRRVCIIDEVIYSQEVKEGKVINGKRIVYGEKWRRTGDGTIFMFFLNALIISAIGLGVIFII